MNEKLVQIQCEYNPNLEEALRNPYHYWVRASKVIAVQSSEVNQRRGSLLVVEGDRDKEDEDAGRWCVDEPIPLLEKLGLGWADHSDRFGMTRRDG